MKSMKMETLVELENSFESTNNFKKCEFFGGTSGAIVVLHSSLSSFVACTHLIRSRVGAIDSSDQSRQGFEQYDTFEVLEKGFQSTFSWLVVKKFSFLVFSRLV